MIAAIATIAAIGLILHSPFSILHSPFSILHSQFSILHGWKFDAEGGAESEFGAFDKDFAVVVFFDDALGE